MRLNFITLLVLLTSPFCTKSQTSVSIGSGVITQQNTFSVVKLAVQSEYRNFILEAAEIPSVSRKIKSGKYFGLSAGYRFGNWIPSAGYFYCLHSSDTKNQYLNHWTYKAGLRYLYMVNYNAGIFAEAMYLDDGGAIIAGIVYTFH